MTFALAGEIDASRESSPTGEICATRESGTSCES